MIHPMLVQLKTAREWSIEVAESCPMKLSEVQHEVFNNTIQWQVGHLLTVAERMMFDFPENAADVPLTFAAWFESGTKPADWSGKIPGLKELIAMLKEQQARLLSISAEGLERRFAQSRFGFFSYSECAGFTALHETLHVGKIEEMLRVIKSM